MYVQWRSKGWGEKRKYHDLYGKLDREEERSFYTHDLRPREPIPDDHMGFSTAGSSDKSASRSSNFKQLSHPPSLACLYTKNLLDFLVKQRKRKEKEKTNFLICMSLPPPPPFFCFIIIALKQTLQAIFSLNKSLLRHHPKQPALCIYLPPLIIPSVAYFITLQAVDWGRTYIHMY